MRTQRLRTNFKHFCRPEQMFPPWSPLELTICYFAVKTHWSLLNHHYVLNTTHYFQSSVRVKNKSSECCPRWDWKHTSQNYDGAENHPLWLHSEPQSASTFSQNSPTVTFSTLKPKSECPNIERRCSKKTQADKWRFVSCTYPWFAFRVH